MQSQFTTLLPREKSKTPFSLRAFLQWKGYALADSVEVGLLFKEYTAFCQCKSWRSIQTLTAFRTIYLADKERREVERGENAFTTRMVYTPESNTDEAVLQAARHAEMPWEFGETIKTLACASCFTHALTLHKKGFANRTENWTKCGFCGGTLVRRQPREDVEEVEQALPSDETNGIILSLLHRTPLTI